jgi:hypothetical protein
VRRAKRSCARAQALDFRLRYRAQYEYLHVAFGPFSRTMVALPPGGIDVPGPASSLRTFLPSNNNILAGLCRRFHWRDGNHTPATTAAHCLGTTVLAPEHVIGCDRLQRLPRVLYQQLPILRHLEYLASDNYCLHGFARAGRFCLLLRNHGGEFGQPGKRIFEHCHQCADSRAVARPALFAPTRQTAALSRGLRF